MPQTSNITPWPQREMPLNSTCPRGESGPTKGHFPHGNVQSESVAHQGDAAVMWNAIASRLSSERHDGSAKR